MPRTLTLRSITFLVVALHGVHSLQGADPLPANWAEKLFDRNVFDLGIVARGVAAQQIIRVTNPFDVPVRIVRVYCNIGLSVVDSSKPRLLSPGESAELTVSAETTKYTRSKETSLTVILNQPKRAEVRLSMKWYVRSDVVVQPGLIRVPPPARGESATNVTKITAIVRAGWKVVSASCENPAIVPSIKEIKRERAEGNLENIEYELTVTTRPDAPAGALSQLILLQLSDQKAPISIPVMFADGTGDQPVFGPSLEYLWSYRRLDGVHPTEPGFVFCIQAAGNLPWHRRLFVVRDSALFKDVLPKLTAGTLKMNDPAILIHIDPPAREIAFHRLDIDGDDVDEVLLTGSGGAGGTSFLQVFQIKEDRVTRLFQDSSRFGFILLDEEGDRRFEIANAGFEFQTDSSHILREKEFTLHKLTDGKFVPSRKLAPPAVQEIIAHSAESTGAPLYGRHRQLGILRVYEAVPQIPREPGK